MIGATFEDYLDEQGQIHIYNGVTLLDLVDYHSRANGDALAYRFIDYSRERDGVTSELNWQQFATRLRAVAARLQQVTEVGDRVAILAPQGLDYVVGIFSAVFAGTIGVPLFDPAEPGHTYRLHAVLGDCEPKAILTTVAAAAGVREFFRDTPVARRPRIIAVDAIPDSVGATWTPPAVDLDAVAYLQYTSGSTRTPAGVEITHRAVGTNLLQIVDAIGIDDNSRGVTWLPLFHDMGLLCVIIPAAFGGSITIMSPSAFVRRPYRWIKELAADASGASTYAAAPNFAFEHAAVRGLPRPDESLDLSNVIGLINGSEPVSVTSMRKFNDAFAPYGLSKTALKPCYGMAEATLFVSATKAEDEAKVLYVDRHDLAAGRMVQVDADAEHAVAQVSCGFVSRSQWGAIVDPATGAELADGQVGEIWLHGENIGRGYWGRAAETEEIFHNRISKRQPDSHAEGVPEDGYWMATGDFGAYFDGELYITGRVKDLVIVDGRNHYPQDLEMTAQEASPALRPGFVAAFSVVGRELPAHLSPGGDSEQLVIVAERGAGAAKLDAEPITETVRTAIAARHGVAVRDLLLVPAGSIPRTSSGKIARRACKTAYLAGTLRGGYKQQDFPDVV